MTPWSASRRVGTASSTFSRGFLLATILFFHIVPTNGITIFCGDTDCYDVLNVEPDASMATIKKAFRKLSLKYHPDKYKGDDAAEKFQEIANAYEILSDETTRKDYDYVRENPHDMYVYAKYGAYRMRKLSQRHSVWHVVGITMILATLAHYLYWWQEYHKYREYALRDPKVQVLMKKLAQRKAQEAREQARDSSEASRKSTSKSSSRSTASKRRSSKSKQSPAPTSKSDPDSSEAELPEVDVYEVVNMVGWQGRKPTFWDILPFQIVYIAVYIVQSIWFYLRWIVKFNLLGKEYGREEEEYLTYKTLNLTYTRWTELSEEQRQELRDKKLWTKLGMKEYRREMIQARRRKKY